MTRIAKTNAPERCHLVLADGTRFPGLAIGARGHTVGEAVFTTGMTGYQEVLTDPSYCDQLVCMTAPQIGNTGTNHEDQEAEAPVLRGFVVHELSTRSSNWRATEELDAYLARNGVVGITQVDTRALTRHIRDFGAQMAAIGTEDPNTLHDRAKSAPPMNGQDLTGKVSTPESYEWTEGTGSWKPLDSAFPADSAFPDEDSAGKVSLDRALQSSATRAATKDYHVVAMDFGVKRSILRCLVDAGCRVTVVPAKTAARDVLALNPDGVFLSNGPGDPSAVERGIATVSELLGKKPLFGICLGHQLLALALGARTYKLKFGHRGLNQPVQDLSTKRIEVTTQNHGFAVDVESLADKCEMTHVHLNDSTCEGIRHLETGAFGVQYHPEASAGPHDARYLFARFVRAIEDSR